MSYLTTNKKLIGQVKVTRHAIDKMRDRLGEKYVGNMKIKNMSHRRIRRLIRKSINKRRKFISEQDDDNLYVRTKDFAAIIDPKFRNIVVTILDH